MSTQTQVFNQFRALFGSEAIPPFEDPQIRSIENLEFVDFLIELVKQTKGQEAFKNVIFRGLLGELNKNDSITEQIIKILKERFYCNFDFTIPRKYTTKSVNGIIMDVGEIDLNDLLTIDPNSREGRLLYDGSDPSVHLNYAIYTGLTATPDNPVKWFGDDGQLLFTLNSGGNNKLVFKFGSEYDGILFSEWSEDFFKTIDLFNLPNFMTTLVNIVTGSISLRVGKTTESIRKESTLIRVLQKIVGFCNEVDDERPIRNNGKEFIEAQEGTNFRSLGPDAFENAFTFTPEESLELDKEVIRKSRGEIKFATCGDLLVPIEPNDIFSRLESLFNNSLADGYDNSLAQTNIVNAIDVFDQSLKDGVKNLVQNGEDDIQVNIPNMRMELETGLLKLIPYALMNMIMGPKLMLYIKVASVLSGEVTTLTVKDVIKLIGEVITDIGREITNLILENIADVVKSELTRLAKVIGQKYLNKRLEDLQAVLGFLNQIIKLAKGLIDAVRDRSVCQSILSKLSSIMSLSYMGPSPMLPFPLVLAGGALKSGLNEVQVIQDLKSDLRRKGIETAPFFADGTPNYMMYAMESLASTLIKHIKLNARIDVGGMAGPIPVQAFGQIT